MINQWRSIPGAVARTALTLLAAASLTGLLAPPAATACSPLRPGEIESPIERAPDNPCQQKP